MIMSSYLFFTTFPFPDDASQMRIETSEWSCSENSLHIAAHSAIVGIMYIALAIAVFRSIILQDPISDNY